MSDKRFVSAQPPEPNRKSLTDYLEEAAYRVMGLRDGLAEEAVNRRKGILLPPRTPAVWWSRIGLLVVTDNQDGIGRICDGNIGFTSDTDSPGYVPLSFANPSFNDQGDYPDTMGTYRINPLTHTCIAWTVVCPLDGETGCHSVYEWEGLQYVNGAERDLSFRKGDSR